MRKILEKIKNLEHKTPESLRDALMILREIDGPKRDDCIWIRRAAKEMRTLDGYEIIQQSYDISARESFDDYMIACEWNREPGARFWMPRRKILEGKHHIASQIQEFLDDPTAIYLGFSLPPGTGKTSMIKFLLAYIAGQHPQSANIYCSYGDGMVRMVFDSVRAIMTDVTEYRHGQIFPLPAPDVSAEYKTISYRRAGDFPTIGMVSLGGSVTGRTRANGVLITDDLVKDSEMARSPERLDRLYSDYKQTLTTRMIGDSVKQIQLGTIWSVHDPISRMKRDHENDDRYRFIAIPVCDEDGHSNFMYDHPDRYTDEGIAKIRHDLDSVSFSCLYMQRGIEREGIAFPEEELVYYGGELPDGEPDNVLFTADVAWGGGDSFSMPIAYVYGEDVYIHDVIFDKGDKSITKPRVVAAIKRNKCRMGRFEANNGGDEYCDDVIRMLGDYRANITHKRASGARSKLSRIEQHAPTIKRFLFRQPSARNDEYAAFMRELTGFSFTVRNPHDDAPDSLAMLADYMTSGVQSVRVLRRLF